MQKNGSLKKRLSSVEPIQHLLLKFCKKVVTPHSAEVGKRSLKLLLKLKNETQRSLKVKPFCFFLRKTGFELLESMLVVLDLLGRKF